MSGQVPRHLLLDGGFGMQLIKHHGRGDLANHPLWSAAVCCEDNSTISDIHLDFMNAGSEAVFTNTYQASEEGFLKHAVDVKSKTDVNVCFQRAITSATSVASLSKSNHTYVFGSIGPYGAYLADRSEYTGVYLSTVTNERLLEFHRTRLALLSSSDVDFVLLETMPGAREVRLLLEQLRSLGNSKPICVTFTSADGIHTRVGEPLLDIFDELTDIAGIVAVGLNCSSLSACYTFLSSLTAELRSRFRVMLKPNLEDQLTPEFRDVFWSRHCHVWKFSEKYRVDWLGGCCNVSSEDIAAMSSSWKCSRQPAGLGAESAEGLLVRVSCSVEGHCDGEVTAEELLLTNLRPLGPL